MDTHHKVEVSDLHFCLTKNLDTGVVSFSTSFPQVPFLGDNSGDLDVQDVVYLDHLVESVRQEYPPIVVQVGEKTIRGEADVSSVMLNCQHGRIVLYLALLYTYDSGHKQVVHRSYLLDGLDHQEYDTLPSQAKQEAESWVRKFHDRQRAHHRLPAKYS